VCDLVLVVSLLGGDGVRAVCVLFLVSPSGSYVRDAQRAYERESSGSEAPTVDTAAGLQVQ